MHLLPILIIPRPERAANKGLDQCLNETFIQVKNRFPLKLQVGVALFTIAPLLRDRLYNLRSKDLIALIKLTLNAK